ncbi:AI-2E family transporter [Oceanihabitans sp. 2_MG-2023]|uniref:AI-2E family transporter n=1 Tax=Oceanihabitans sp. 2_MG-2023 TaxID=3062661 RepID=UPI0026E16395|nr:AI-2E family transporter [Oceanihabitans sp. 2_MG-2023]MDO6597758.1 AI-2E family transporter [Oceanihabitans sp. 2_MG-2023]
MLNERRTTNILLLIIVIPIMFYLLKVLSFIFIPLVFAMFIALLFLPVMRWLSKRRVPKIISILIVLLLIAVGLKIGVELIKLSSKQIMASDTAFFDKAEVKLSDAALYLENTFGLELQQDKNFLSQFIEKENIGTTVGFLRKFFTMLLMTAFFVVLLLAESINMQDVLNKMVLKKKRTSLLAYGKIQKELNTFIKVKFLVSFLTGVGTGLACYFFDVSFPIFWGLFAFVINFVQMVGSFIAVIALSIFAFVELDPTSTLFFFIVAISGVQVLFGAILEPVFMGKSFSINIITVLVMLMFWGFLWGIPGLIMAIPITVFLKIIFEQFPSTKKISDLIS